MMQHTNGRHLPMRLWYLYTSLLVPLYPQLSVSEAKGEYIINPTSLYVTNCT